jgi:hypothetical protein
MKSTKYLVKLSRINVSEKFLNRLCNLGYFFCLVLAIGVIYISYIHSYYNWDLDHEIYFGQQLINGDLIWVKEFHDKLPLVQTLFGISSVFGGIQAWRTVSWLSIIFTSMIILLVLPQLMKKSSISIQLRKKMSGIFALCYPIWIFNLPDDITNINAIAVSFFTSATLVLLVLVDSQLSLRSILVKSFTIFSILLYAIAISIRPYFLFPVLVYLLYLSFSGLRTNNINNYKIILSCFFKYTSLLFLFGCILNFMPYIFTNQLNFLITGLRMIFLDWNSETFFLSIINTIVSRNSFIFLICFFSIIFFSLILIFKFKDTSGQLIFHNLAAVGLFVSIMFVHWWPHYLTLFCGSLLMIASSSINTLFSDKKGANQFKTLRYRGYLLGILGMVFTLMIANVFVKSAVIVNREINHLKPERFEELNAFNEFIHNTARVEDSFLAPENMYIHWKLNEPRHGFPHAAHTYAVVRNLWVTRGELARYGFPNSLVSYCNLIESSDVELIILKDSSVIPNGCFSTQKTKYKLKYNLDLKGNEKSLLVYAKS